MCEDAGGATAVGTMDDGDILVGQRNARIESGDLRVVPGFDLAHEDVGQHRAGQFQMAVDAAEIVGYSDGTKRDRNMNNGTIRTFCQLRVGHRRIGGAEIDERVEQVIDASAAADELVINVGAALDAGINSKKLREERAIERRSCSVERSGRGATLRAIRAGGCRAGATAGRK